MSPQGHSSCANEGEEHLGVVIREVRARFRLFAGSANPDLAAAVARQLDVPLGARVVERFPMAKHSFDLKKPCLDMMYSSSSRLGLQ